MDMVVARPPDEAALLRRAGGGEVCPPSTVLRCCLLVVLLLLLLVDCCLLGCCLLFGTVNLLDDGLVLWREDEVFTTLFGTSWGMLCWVVDDVVAPPTGLRCSMKNLFLEKIEVVS